MFKIKVGIAGKPEAVGQYLTYLQKNDSFEVIGSFDSTDANNFESFYGISPFTDFIKRADAIIFCGNEHQNTFDILAECIKNCKHILFDKFPDLSYTELSLLNKFKTEADTLFYIANIPGLGCVYTTARQSVSKPTFIQYKIQIPFNTHFTDGNSKELMHETIDMVLRCVNSPVHKVKINRQYIFNQSPDEVKVHITFDNSSTSEIVLNTVSQEAKHALTLYQKGKIIHADIAAFKVEETRLDVNLEHQLPFDSPEASHTSIAQKMHTSEKKIMYFDVIQKDLLNFVDCISNRVSPLVSIDEAINVVSVMQHFTYSQHESFV